MAPSLKISAGPSVDKLQTVAVNHDDKPTEVVSDVFQGRIAVRIKDFTGSDPEGVTHAKDTPYFDAGLGKGQSWSMQIQGRFLGDNGISGDDLVFGNEFDKPIKDHLPYGTAVALQFARIVDTTLEHDLYHDKPHAWSPYIATMPRLSAQALASSSSSGDDKFKDWPAFPAAPDNVHDDVTSLIPEELAQKDKDTIANMKGGPDGIEKAHEYRRRYFTDKHHREQITFTSDQIVTADFFNGFIDFNDLTLHIPYAGNLKFDLKKYWDGQPVRYICKNKSTGTVFFVIQFDITDMNQ